jgi:hypothetical protein
MNLLARFKQRNRPSENGTLPDFSGKILVIYPNSEGLGGGMFQDAKAVSIGFNVFVVGRRVGLEPPLQQSLVKGHCLDVGSRNRTNAGL